jgi:hypothetical protein
MRAELDTAGLYMHQGTMQTPATLDYNLTDTTTGLAQSFFANDYHSGDVLYDRANFPRVTHGVWKGRDGTILVVFINWTFEDAAWAGTLDIESMGLGIPGTHRARQIGVQLTGGVAAGVHFDYATGKLSIDNIPALSVCLVKLEHAPGHKIVVRVPTKRWDRSTG